MQYLGYTYISFKHTVNTNYIPARGLVGKTASLVISGSRVWPPNVRKWPGHELRSDLRSFAPNPRASTTSYAKQTVTIVSHRNDLVQPVCLHRLSFPENKLWDIKQTAVTERYDLSSLAKPTYFNLFNLFMYVLVCCLFTFILTMILFPDSY